MGKPAARIGDMHTCPMVTPGLPPVPHVGGPVTGPGVPTVLIGGMPAAVMGDMCVCVGPPDTIIMGSTGVFIGGKPAARMGDSTVHGGVVSVGCPTVLIGETAGGGSGGGAIGPFNIKAMEPALMTLTPMSLALSLQLMSSFFASKSDEGPIFCEKCNEAAKGLLNKTDVVKNDEVEAGDTEEDGLQGPHAEAEYSIYESDSALGIGGKAEAGVLAVNSEFNGQYGGGSSSVDIGHAMAEGYAGFNKNGLGYGARGKAEAEVLKTSVGGYLGSDNNNPIAKGEVEGKLLSAGAGGEFLFGDSGEKVGFIAEGGLGASVASAEGALTFGIPIPFTKGKTIQFAGKAGASAASAGIGGGAHGYYDKNEKRAHAGGKIKLEALIGGELDFDISFGDKFKDPQA